MEPTPAPTTPVQPTTQTASASQAPKGGSKMMLWMIMGLIATILIVGVVYWYLSNLNTKPTENTTLTQSSNQTSNLEGDLDAIAIPEVDANFTEVDKDLGNL